MNKTKYFLLSLLAVLSSASCSTDADLISSSGAQAVELDGSGDVVLDKNHKPDLALTLYWTDNSRLSTSDERVQAPAGTTANTLQFAGTEDFSSPVEVLTKAGSTSLQYTVEALNTLAGRLGLAGDTPSPLYIRMKSVLANNLDPVYSNVYRIQVTPYRIDMSRAFILASDRTDTGRRLSSPESDGIYRGFVGAAGWYNWWLQEGDGTLWGNVGDDGGGKAFAAGSGETHWNFWFPGPSGCYYTVVNTPRQEWSALYIPSLSVSGAIEGEMTYDRKTGRWTLPFHAASAGEVRIRISGTGRQYNVSTGTDDEAALRTDVAFGMENGKITFGSVPTDITVQVPSAGDQTLMLDLSDPTGWTCTAGKGSTSEEVPGKLYILGNDDLWDYTEYLTLYDEDNLCYAAAVSFNSSWGYYFSKAYQDWTEIDQDPATEEKKLTVKGRNIPQPGKGLYVVCASLGWMNYWYPMDEAVTEVAYAGFNDSWEPVGMRAVEGRPGVYTATVAATAGTPWGAQILLNGSWTHFFGTQGDGTLRWGRKGTSAPKGWKVGKTYTFTVDLCKGTYTLTEQ